MPDKLKPMKDDSKPKLTLANLSNLPKPDLSRLPKPDLSRVSSGGRAAGSRVGAWLKNLYTRIVNYLNGPVSNRFFSHPAVRWGLVVVLVVYVAIGAVVGWKTYKVKSESTNIRRILTIYPFPAVLMPQDVILVRDYLSQLNYIRHFSDKTKQPLPSDPELRAQLISQAIDTRLLLRAMAKYNVKVTRADIDAVYQKIAETNGGTQELHKLLNDLYSMQEKDFRIVVRDQLLREKTKKEILLQVHVKHILVHDQKRAQEILDQLKKDPSKFGELAKQFSEDTTTRDKDGDLGFIARGVMNKAFEDAAFKLQANQLAPEPVKSDLGYHIILVSERKGKVDMTFDDYMKSLRNNKKIWTIYK